MKTSILCSCVCPSYSGSLSYSSSAQTPDGTSLRYGHETHGAGRSPAGSGTTPPEERPHQGRERPDTTRGQDPAVHVVPDQCDLLDAHRSTPVSKSTITVTLTRNMPAA